MTILNQLTLNEKIARCLEEAKTREPRYKRREARILIGYDGTTASFSQWLRDNHFLLQQDYPESALIKRGILEVHVKTIYKAPRYDCCNSLILGSSENHEPIKSIYTPLFTLKGIAYFRKLLNDETLLTEEVNKIILSNKPHS